MTDQNKAAAEIQATNVAVYREVEKLRRELSVKIKEQSGTLRTDRPTPPTPVPLRKAS